MTKKRSSQAKIKGFTLIELLIVIVILGLLMSLVAPTMFSKVSSTKTKTAEMQMEMLSSALDTYRLDLGRYPEKLVDLRTSDNEKWNGPYMPKEIPLDPWDNPYVYERVGDAGTDYILRSYGADGSEGGEGEAADVIYK